MLSSTLSSGTRLSSWLTSAMPRACASCGFRSDSSSPSKRMTPSSGRTSPTSDFTSVLLPAPLCPQIACTSPARTSSDSFSTARTGPYDLERSTTSRSTGPTPRSPDAERDPEAAAAGSRSSLIERASLLEGADLRELGDVRLRDPRLLDVGDLRRLAAREDLRRHLDRERRLDLRRLGSGAVLGACLDRVDADRETVAAGDDQTLLRDANRHAGLLRALDDPDGHVVGHAVRALNAALRGVLREQLLRDLGRRGLVPVGVLDGDDLVLRELLQVRLESRHPVGHVVLARRPGQSHHVALLEAGPPHAFDEVL